MLISADKNSDLGIRFMKAFTVKNKNIDKLENMQGRPMPWMRFIKLYAESSHKIYVPVGQFSKQLKRRHPLETKIKYITDPSKIQDSMKEMLEEQEIILDHIDYEGQRTGLIVMKTARGKGNLIIQLIERFQEKTLILCHSIKTVTELRQKFLDFSDCDPALYYSKKKQIRDITITTHKSFVDKTELFRGKFGLIIQDECDTNISPKMTEALATVDADGLFGLTGTPERADLDIDDMQLIFGPVIKVENQKNNGYNMIPDIYRLQYVNNRIYSFEDFRDLQNQLMDDEKRILAQGKFIKEHSEGRLLSLLLVDRIKECELYKNVLDSLGVECEIVNGNTSEEEDEKNISRLKECNGVIIGTSKKMYRGVDIPQIDTMYLFYPNRFHATIVQSVGRGLRAYPGKKDVKLYDWGDLPVLKGQFYDRNRAYQKEYPDPKIEILDIKDD